MPCYSPLHGYYSRVRNASGKRSIVFSLNQGFRDRPVVVPCGQCIGCRLEHSRQWAIRAVHESKLYSSNCFVTLTYRPEELPRYGSLVREHPQLWMKRLRERVRRAGGEPIRVFGCGEYGERTKRPHYHAIIFNWDPQDKVHETTINGNPLYSSKILEDVWTHGHCSVGAVTFESAAYVARYVTKKVKGEKALEFYNKIDPETGEILEERLPEFPFRSQGIGKGWLNKYINDVYPDDFVLLRGKKLKPPKYYNAQYEKVFPSEYAKLKRKRKLAAEIHSDNNTYERLRVREELQYRKLDLLKRNYENED